VPRRMRYLRGSGARTKHVMAFYCPTQLVISEIDSSAATSLQAVKLLALYLTGDKVSAQDLNYVASDLALIALCWSGSGSL
ncbi:hypothetical protein ACJX0J_041703, partial [Zea mays]